MSSRTSHTQHPDISACTPPPPPPEAPDYDSSRGHVVSLSECPQVGQAVQHPRVEEPGVLLPVLPPHVAADQVCVVLL